MTIVTFPLRASALWHAWRDIIRKFDHFYAGSAIFQYFNTGSVQITVKINIFTQVHANFLKKLSQGVVVDGYSNNTTSVLDRSHISRNSTPFSFIFFSSGAPFLREPVCKFWERSNHRKMCKSAFSEKGGVAASRPGSRNALAQLFLYQLRIFLHIYVDQKHVYRMKAFTIYEILRAPLKMR